MDTGLGLAAVRARVAQAMWAVFAVLAVMISSSPATGAVSPTAAAVTALTVVLVGLATIRARSSALVVGCVAARQPARDEVPPVLSGRPTDPVHHPLRPRAPGLA